MTGFDFLIIGIIGFSAAIGVWRGFVREGLSLSKWVIATVLAWLFAYELTGLFESSIDNPTLRLAAAFIFVFIVGYLLGSYVTSILNKLLSSRRFLKLTNNLLGGTFGALRGLLVVIVIFLLAGLTTLPQSGWWRGSSMVPPFQSMALFTSEFLPRDIAQHIHYD